ncbi:transglycosylase [Mycobacterium bohemicum]|nr:transglycosylase [Mycobacterium bohemicum]MCV6972793.1 transglycosylase [Mycobacterium bohemicum]
MRRLNAAGESLADPLITQALAALSRGHMLFVGAAADGGIRDTPAQVRARADGLITRSRGLPPSTTQPVAGLRRLADSDGAVARTIAAARADHARRKSATGAVLEAARADRAPGADTPIGRREATARMAARLRTQHRHVEASRRRARLLASRLLRPHYARRPATGRAAVLAAIHKALDIKGFHDPAVRARWERGMALVALRESNYDAGAVNGWDCNAARGTPSRGAWQFIAPTFAAYHQRGTSSQINDLVAQACAFINYARGHYGVAADASNLADRIQQADPRRSPKGY